MNALLVTLVGLFASLNVVLGTKVPEHISKGLVTTKDATSAPVYILNKDLLGWCVKWPVNKLSDLYPTWNIIAYTKDSPEVTFTRDPIPFDPPEFYCGTYKYGLARLEPGTKVNRGREPAGYHTWAFAGDFEHTPGSPVVKFKNKKGSRNRKHK